ncbi:hypothetical protein [Bacteroides ovatus]|nr:hypothetical protein [Bacteroides ovatus]
MENLFFIYFLINFIAMIPVAYAADKRIVSTGWAALITLIFSPVIGFLFVLCYPTKAESEYQEKMLLRMNNILERLPRKE